MFPVVRFLLPFMLRSLALFKTLGKVLVLVMKVVVLLFPMLGSFFPLFLLFLLFLDLLVSLFELLVTLVVFDFPFVAVLF